MKNLKLTDILRTFIGIFAFLFFIKANSHYEKINDLFIQKKENYSELKELNERIISDYQINLPVESELHKLNQKIEYNEYMIDGLESTSVFADYFWWILIGLVLCSLFLWWSSNNEDEKV